MSHAHLLRNVSLFAQATEEELATISVDFVLQTFHKNQVIFRQGSVTNSLYIVKSGSVRVIAFDRNHGITYTGLYGPNQYFGEFSLLDGLPRSAEAVSLSNADLLVLTRPAFFRFLEQNPTFAIKLLVTISRRMRFAAAAVDHPVSYGAETDIANVLIQITERYALNPESPGDVIRLGMRLTADDLASLSGVARDLAAEVVSMLATRGIVCMERTHLITVNLPKLRSLLAEEVRV